MMGMGYKVDKGRYISLLNFTLWKIFALRDTVIQFQHMIACPSTALMSQNACCCLCAIVTR
jgi:hypothetical protein